VICTFTLSICIVDAQKVIILLIILLVLCLHISLDSSIEVGTALLKWVYTDKADIRNDESFIMDLVRVANRYQLNGLRNR
jgi:hypothetical protein